MPTLFEESPFAYVINKDEANSFCHFCCAKREPLLRCPGCNFANYCSFECLEFARKDHREECVWLQKTRPVVPSDHVRMLARILVQLKENPKQLQSSDDGNRTFWMLMSHAQEIKENAEEFQRFLAACAELFRYVDNKYLPHSVDTMLEIYGKYAINAFTMRRDVSGYPFGTALYLQISVIDHSCDADAAAVFNRSKLILNWTRSREIPENMNWKTIKISYIDLYTALDDRQCGLQETFFFTCSCSICTDNHWECIRYSLRCTDPGCDGPVIPKDQGGLKAILRDIEHQSAEELPKVPGICEKCSSEIFDMISGLQVANRASMVFTELKSEWKNSSAFGKLERIRKAIDEAAILHPFNLFYNQLIHCCVNVMYGISDLAEEQKQWLRENHKDYIRCFRVCHYSRPDPAVAYRLLVLSDLLLRFGTPEDLKEAEQCLQQAVEDAKITHGEGHVIFDKIRDSLDEIAKREAEQKEGHGQEEIMVIEETSKALY